MVLACCGDIPTLETLAAADVLRQRGSSRVSTCGLSTSLILCAFSPTPNTPTASRYAQFDTLFTPNRPVVLAYHGYPWAIHRLTYRRTNHANIHVRGYKEEGTTTTPFDMVMLNDLDRYHLVMDVIDRVPGLASSAGHVRQLMMDKRISCRAYTREHGEDAPEITNWKWPF